MIQPWDPHPDGEWFLMISLPGDVTIDDAATGNPQINVVLNWFEELNERVPVP